MYEVKQEDLIGDIEGFPIEVVQRMIERQVEQGNKADVSVFQNRKSCSGGSGGFEWCDTTERHDFWQKVILNRDFKIFFEKYPKENKEIYVENVDGQNVTTEWNGFTLNKIEIKESLKYDNEKLRWDLLPLEDIEDVVKVYTEGAKKYVPNSWQNLTDGYNRYKAAMFRHLLEYEKGNTIDEETGCKHLAQVVWNAIAMLHVSKNK